jgi:hypothetical protein
VESLRPHPQADNAPRAHASRNIDFDSDIDRSIERLRAAQKNDYDETTFEAARHALHSHQAKHARERNPNSPDDQIVAEFLAIAEWPRLEAMLYDLAAERKEAGYSYAWFVTVALQRIHGLSPQALKAAREKIAQRKPARFEKQIADLAANKSMR